MVRGIKDACWDSAAVAARHLFHPRPRTVISTASSCHTPGRPRARPASLWINSPTRAGSRNRIDTSKLEKFAASQLHEPAIASHPPLPLSATMIFA